MFNGEKKESPSISKKQLKKYKKNNEVRSSLLKITYNETKSYLEKSFTKLNDKLPSQIAKNFSVEIHINNPIIIGSKKKEREKHSFKSRAGSISIYKDYRHSNSNNTNIKFPLYEQITENILKVDSNENVRELLMSRKKTIASKKMENNMKNMSQLNLDDDTISKENTAKKDIEEICNFSDNNNSISEKKKAKDSSFASMNKKYEKIDKSSSFLKIIPDFNLKQEKEKKIIDNSIAKLRSIVGDIKIINIQNIEKNTKSNSVKDMCQVIDPKINNVNSVSTADKSMKTLPLIKNKININNTNDIVLPIIVRENSEKLNKAEKADKVKSNISNKSLSSKKEIKEKLIETPSENYNHLDHLSSKRFSDKNNTDSKSKNPFNSYSIRKMLDEEYDLSQVDHIILASNKPKKSHEKSNSLSINKPLLLHYRKSSWTDNSGFKEFKEKKFNDNLNFASNFQGNFHDFLIAKTGKEDKFEFKNEIMTKMKENSQSICSNILNTNSSFNSISTNKVNTNNTNMSKNTNTIITNVNNIITGNNKTYEKNTKKYNKTNKTTTKPNFSGFKFKSDKLLINGFLSGLKNDLVELPKNYNKNDDNLKYPVKKKLNFDINLIEVEESCESNFKNSSDENSIKEIKSSIDSLKFYKELGITTKNKMQSDNNLILKMNGLKLSNKHLISINSFNSSIESKMDRDSNFYKSKKSLLSQISAEDKKVFDSLSYVTNQSRISELSKSNKSIISNNSQLEFDFEKEK